MNSLELYKINVQNFGAMMIVATLTFALGVASFFLQNDTVTCAVSVLLLTIQGALFHKFVKPSKMLVADIDAIAEKLDLSVWLDASALPLILRVYSLTAFAMAIILVAEVSNVSG